MQVKASTPGPITSFPPGESSPLPQVPTTSDLPGQGSVAFDDEALHAALSAAEAAAIGNCTTSMSGAKPGQANPAPPDESLERLDDAAKTLFTSVRDAISGIGRNLGEAFEAFFRGFATLFSTHPDVKDVGQGLARLAQTPVDAALLTLGGAASAVQTLLGIEQPARGLSQEERQQLAAVFGNSVDYDRVRLKEGSAGVLTVFGRAFTLGNTIFLPQGASAEVLAHEMTHVWQHQAGGSDYLSEALISRYVTGTEPAAYQWRQVVPKTPWAELNPEQQGQFLQDAMAEGAFHSTPPRFTELPGGYTQDLDSLNRYLDSALAEINQRHGAP